MFNNVILPDGYESQIVHAGLIRPTLNADGTPFTYKSYSENSPYYGRSGYEVMRLNKALYGVSTVENETIGDKDFCHICITNNETSCLESDSCIDLPNETGVYLWVINNTVVYIGRAHTSNQTLYKRYKNGYSKISARPCVCKVIGTKKVNGQITNMKMNRLVLNMFNEGSRIDLYYILTPRADLLEKELLEMNWNRRVYARNAFFPLMYNSRR